MVDLPQHAAQVGTWLHWDDGFPYSDYLWINHETPYLVANILAALLSLWLPIHVAFKVVVSLAILGVPLATLALIYEVRGNPLWAFLAIPAGYSFSLFMGFVAFALATALALLFLLVAWRQMEIPSRRGAWTIFFGLQLLFITHPLAFGWVGLTGALLVLTSAGDWRAVLLGWRPYLAALVLPISWIVLTLSRDTLVAGTSGYHLSRLLQPVTFAVGLPIYDLSLVLGVIVLAAPFLGGGRPSHRWARWIPFLTSLGLLLVTPQLLLGANYIHQRFGALLVPTLLFALSPTSPSDTTRRGRFFVLAPTLVWMMFLQIQFLGFRNEAGAFGEILKRMEPNRQVLYLPLDARSEFLPFPSYLHFGSWYQAESGGLVDFSFATYFQMRYRYLPERVPNLPLGFEFRPWTFDWETNDGQRYDYFLVRSPQDPSPLFVRAGAPLRPVASAFGGWWLFARIPQ